MSTAYTVTEWLMFEVWTLGQGITWVLIALALFIYPFPQMARTRYLRTGAVWMCLLSVVSTIVESHIMSAGGDARMMQAFDLYETANTGMVGGIVWVGIGALVCAKSLVRTWTASDREGAEPCF